MPGGRPTSYEPEFAAQAEKLCRLGATDAEMANFFEVDEATINRWKHAQPEFCASLKRGKMEADSEVATALYRRAIGYEHDGKHYPPDPTSCIFWLKNRRADLWRDAHKQEHAITTSEKSDISPEERARQAAEMVDRAFGRIANS